MAIFGKKKLSLEDILKGIADLSEEEKATVLSSIQENKTEYASEENETDSGVEEIVESEETESPAETVEETAETNVEETEVEESGTPVPMAETPTETAQVEESIQEHDQNYDELFAAQNARISSLESQLASFKETLENVVTNQDKQNFGYSPKAHFDEDNSSSRYDAVMQGYAPRRADQYK